MTDQFFDPSEKILNMKAGNPVGVRKYPWAEVPTGKSFTINDKSAIKFKVLRSLASKMGKKLGRKFRVAEHDGCYEVNCRIVTEVEAVSSAEQLTKQSLESGKSIWELQTKGE